MGLSIEEKQFGYTKQGDEIHIYTLMNKNGVRVGIMNYGGSIVFFETPDRQGAARDIVLGYDTLSAYEEQTKYVGATVGRHCNRIEKAKFTLNGKNYLLAENDGKNHLHGGLQGFDRKVFTANIEQDELKLRCISPDGEEGYPGNLSLTITYELTEKNELIIGYQAKSDQDTLCNLTNHSYFNLKGQGKGDISSHKLQIFADSFTVNNAESLPTGEIRKVEGTPMDFRVPHAIGERIDQEDQQLQFAKGYDHNWVLNEDGRKCKKAAYAWEESSGICLTVFTTMPGLQLYTGNFLEGAPMGKGGVVYHNREAFCLEAQYFPNSMQYEHFPKPILRAGQEYSETIRFQAGLH